MATKSQSGPQILVLLILVVIGVMWFKRRHPAEEPKPVAADAPAQPAPADPEPAPAPPPEEKPPEPSQTAAPPPQTPPATGQTQAEFQAEFSKCYPELGTPASLTDFIESEMNSADVEEREATQENIHINDGVHEQQLNILPRGENAEVHIFTIDDQGRALPQGHTQWMTADAAL